MVIGSTNAEIQLTKDRDRISVELRGKFEENSKWYDLASILELASFTEHLKYSNNSDYSYSNYLLYLNQLKIGLEKKYIEIQVCLNSPKFLERLDLYIEKKSKQLYEELLIKVKNQQVK